MRRRLGHLELLTSGLLALIPACGGGREAPDFERMRQQQRLDPYEASTLFADGMAMRTPPAGTVPHESSAASPAIATGVDRGAPVREIPLAITPELLASGQHHFDIYCAVCHGADGAGRSVMAENMPGGPPPSLLTPEVAADPAGHLFAVISDGQKRMPSYGWALPPADRWAVVAYLRALQRARSPTAATAGGRPR
jgi:mono/diheme cytochrome c family protein